MPSKNSLPKSPVEKTIDLVAGPDDAGTRLDRWLAGKVPDLSRSRLQALIRDGHVRSGATIREARTPVKPGATYTIEMPAPEPSGVEGEDIALDVVYEDADIIVIDKPAGLVVHPAAGHATGTLVNALINHCGASLSGIGGVKRPGIVHRLDKDTSGILVVAKNDTAHQSLSDQFKSHGHDGRLRRTYLAYVWGVPLHPKGVIDAPLARSQSNRTKISVVHPEKGRHAVTHYEVLETFPGDKPTSTVALLRLELETGRTHQIRVHLAHIGHPVLGDPVYAAGFKTRLAGLHADARAVASNLRRQALHAETLAFEHPGSLENMSFTSELPDDLRALDSALRLAGRREEPTEKAILRRSKKTRL